MTCPAPRILVVDDDVDACANLHDILTDFGFEVSTAPTGETAMDLVRRCRFDAALLDLKLPGMNGLELSRQLKCVSADTAVVIVSAYAGGDSAEQALAVGARTVLNKPVNVEQLLPLLMNSISQSKNTREQAG